MSKTDFKLIMRSAFLSGTLTSLHETVFFFLKNNIFPKETCLIPNNRHHRGKVRSREKEWREEGVKERRFIVQQRTVKIEYSKAKASLISLLACNVVNLEHSNLHFFILLEQIHNIQLRFKI